MGLQRLQEACLEQRGVEEALVVESRALAVAGVLGQRVTVTVSGTLSPKAKSGGVPSKSRDQSRPMGTGRS